MTVRSCKGGETVIDFLVSSFIRSPSTAQRHNHAQHPCTPQEHEHYLARVELDGDLVSCLLDNVGSEASLLGVDDPDPLLAGPFLLPNLDLLCSLGGAQRVCHSLAPMFFV